MIKDVAYSSNESPADYARISREINNSDYLRDVSVAFLSSYTMEILKPYIHVELAKRGLFSSTYFAPYNNLEQEINNNNSGLHSFNPDVVVIHNRIEDINLEVLTRFYSYSVDELENEVESIILRFRDILETLRKKSNALIIIINFAYTQDQVGNFVGSQLSHSISMYIQNINNQLWKLCSEITSCYVINYQQLLLEYGLHNWIDSRLYFLGRIPFSGNAQIKMGKALARTISATCVAPCKCLVLDLDNTLWGGVLGEDGISGIQLGDDYPGNVYKSFQRTILSLRDQGILLAIASKNNISDAMEVIEKHTSCLIKKKHLSSIQINWNDKATNIHVIAKELNIGIDTIAFFDDNPVEREWVKKQIPEVKVIDVPKNPILYSWALLGSELFDKVSLTREDKNRADIYNQEKKRNEFHVKSKSVDNFLEGLEMSVTLGFVGDITLSRVEQLVNKTNQFNLTCIRHTAENIKMIINSGGVAIWMSVKDKFGDSGVVGIAIAKKMKDGQWLIDTFLLSCRVIGRKLDLVLLNYICKIVKGKGGSELYGEYIATPRNGLVCDFFVEHGFDRVVNKSNYWSYNLKAGSIKYPDFIRSEFVG